MRKVFFGFAALLLLTVITQFYLATFGAFQRPAPTTLGDWGATTPHVINGVMVIPVLSLLTTIVAAVAKAGARLVWLSIAPVGVVVGQLFVIFPLAELSGGTPERTNTLTHIVMGFHAVLELLLLLTSVLLFRGARNLASAATVAPHGDTARTLSSSF
ncbi:hypothetical protein GCM10010517_04760 [Streptosporangium fragile]|uniref:DUF4383 domain-containing protein n=1 Tax=Streptosporangium fragile TaxID=46186 RepID=A0ABN3VR57_9ACTN